MAENHHEALAFSHHDHRECQSSAIVAAEAYCEQNHLNLTPVRRRVLEILLSDHRALGAYAILDLLRDAGFKSQPPVAYRALDFLTEHGFAHKIERLNAFVACVHPQEDHAPAFMICRRCEAVAEANTTPETNALAHAAKDAGFQIERTVIEAEGICPDCNEGASQ